MPRRNVGGCISEYVDVHAYIRTYVYLHRVLSEVSLPYAYITANNG